VSSLADPFSFSHPLPIDLIGLQRRRRRQVLPHRGQQREAVSALRDGLLPKARPHLQHVWDGAARKLHYGLSYVLSLYVQKAIAIQQQELILLFLNRLCPNREKVSCVVRFSLASCSSLTSTDHIKHLYPLCRRRTLHLLGLPDALRTSRLVL
jgi:hypothetical protein